MFVIFVSLYGSRPSMSDIYGTYLHVWQILINEWIILHVMLKWWKKLWRVWQVWSHVLLVIVQLVDNYTLFYSRNLLKIQEMNSSEIWTHCFESKQLRKSVSESKQPLIHRTANHCVNSRSVCVSVHHQTWGMLGVPLTASG